MEGATTNPAETQQPRCPQCSFPNNRHHPDCEGATTDNVNTTPRSALIGPITTTRQKGTPTTERIDTRHLRALYADRTLDAAYIDVDTLLALIDAVEAAHTYWHSGRTDDDAAIRLHDSLARFQP